MIHHRKLLYEHLRHKISFCYILVITLTKKDWGRGVQFIRILKIEFKVFWWQEMINSIEWVFGHCCCFDHCPSPILAFLLPAILRGRIELKNSKQIFLIGCFFGVNAFLPFICEFFFTLFMWKIGLGVKGCEPINGLGKDISFLEVFSVLNKRW